MLIVFLTGGSARSDVQSVAILRPFAVATCGLGLWSLRKEHVAENRFLFILLAITTALVGIYSLPLPSSIWHSMPGRALIASVDDAAALGDVARPAVISPVGGWNSLSSLTIPLAVLVLGAQLTREEIFKLLPLLLGLGLASGLFGLLQVVGDPQSSLYFYRITNNGSAVGLFANRNHLAILLTMIFPMLAVYASVSSKAPEQTIYRKWAAVSASIVLLPLILVTGSRAGLLIGSLTLIAAIFLYHQPAAPGRKTGKPKINLRIPVFGFAIVMLGSLTALLSRAEAWERLTRPGEREFGRFAFWKPVAEMGSAYFPLGSGAGSFVELYAKAEPHALLDPSYLNHAHNDWLELYTSFGLPGMLMVIATVLAMAFVSRDVFRGTAGHGRDTLFARLGIIMLAVMALGSIGDYPLRTPTMSALLVVAALWAHRRSWKGSQKRMMASEKGGSDVRSSLART